METSSDNFIAIVGMSARFAGAANLREYWRGILAARPAIAEIDDPAAERFLHEDANAFRRLPSLHAGRLGDLWRSASPARNGEEGLSPESVLAGDLAAAAMKDAGAQGAQGVRRSRIGAYVGNSPSFGPAQAAWAQHGFVVDQTMEIIRRCFPHGDADDFEELRSSLDGAIPEIGSRGARALMPQAIAASVAESCNIEGPAFCVDGGDISGAIAIQAGCDALLAGRVDLALSGGVQGPVLPQLLMPFARMGLISRSGALRPFTKKADGTLLGEGGGFVAMKRHADAVRDGDRIYAVVRAVATASGGNSRRIEGGYAEALRAVWPPRGQDTGLIDLLEANGAGIPNLDRAELKAFCAATADMHPQRDSIALGTVKALVGDCLAAAGLASAIKAAMALYNRVIPPGLPQAALDAGVDIGGTPFYVPARPRPWIHNDAGSARRAGVSSIALGGTASFLVLEQTSR